MRALARHYGVPAFGTYALYETLMSTSIIADLPSDLDFKRSLISSRIADVPLTWAELDAISQEDGSGTVGFVLERPSSWINPVQAFRWFRQTMNRLQDAGRTDEAPYLLYAATLGAGRAVDKDSHSPYRGHTALIRTACRASSRTRARIRCRLPSRVPEADAQRRDRSVASRRHRSWHAKPTSISSIPKEHSLDAM